MQFNLQMQFNEDIAFNQSIKTNNKLLDGLPSEERQSFTAYCESVNLTVGKVIYKAGDAIQYVYFPTESTIFLVNPLDGNAGMKVALIGNEGMLGITLMLGTDIAPLPALVQSEGSALRISKKMFLEKLQECHELQLRFKRYIYISFSQLVQANVCNRFHVVEERLARLLLMIKDRKHSKEFYITQELLAQMLGVRRVGVTKAAGSLQERKLISYCRGQVKILDIAGLEAVSCICYKTDKETYARILSTKQTSTLN